MVRLSNYWFLHNTKYQDLQKHAYTPGNGQFICDAKRNVLIKQQFHLVIFCSYNATKPASNLVRGNLACLVIIPLRVACTRLDFMK